MAGAAAEHAAEPEELVIRTAKGVGATIAAMTRCLFTTRFGHCMYQAENKMKTAEKDAIKRSWRDLQVCLECLRLTSEWLVYNRLAL